MEQVLRYRQFPSEGSRLIWLLATDAELERFRQLSPFKCKHPRTEVRDYRTSNGGWQRKAQCLVCGRSASNAQKRIDGDGTPSWDQDLEPIYDAQLNEARNELLEFLQDRTEAMLEPGYVSYEAYLQSDEWKKRRDLVLKRDGNLCQGCLNEPATEVHHLTYERVFKEPLFDLVSVCKTCHEAVHDKGALARVAAEKVSNP